MNVADPIGTHLDHIYDEQIESLHLALAADDYTPDHFYTPWDQAADANSSTDADDKEKGAMAQNQQAAEEPGLLLYRWIGARKADAKSHEKGEGIAESKDSKLLAVFLVAEKPTSGIRSEPFHRAVRCIASYYEYQERISQQPRKRQVMIAGPTFSGGADSLARAIRLAQEKWKCSGYDFTVITGLPASAIHRERFLKLAAARPESVSPTNTLEYLVAWSAICA